MASIIPTSNTETANSIPTLPTLEVQVDKPSDDRFRLVAEFINSMGISKILGHAVQAIKKLLFYPESEFTHVKSITIRFVESIPERPRMREFTRIDQGEVCISLWENYVWALQTVQGDEKAKEWITETILKYVGLSFWYHFDDSGYSVDFGLGLMNYVRLKEGSLPPYYESRETESTWYGKTTMPYFLEFLNQTFGEGTAQRIILALASPYKYDSCAFQQVTGKPITNLWEMYLESRGIKQTRGEQQISGLKELWPIPDVSVSVEEELVDFFRPSDLRETLVRAVLATFYHLFPEPWTVRPNVNEFRLVLRSGEGKVKEKKIPAADSSGPKSSKFCGPAENFHHERPHLDSGEQYGKSLEYPKIGPMSTFKYAFLGIRTKVLRFLGLKYAQMRTDSGKSSSRPDPLVADTSSTTLPCGCPGPSVAGILLPVHEISVPVFLSRRTESEFDKLPPALANAIKFKNDIFSQIIHGVASSYLSVCDDSCWLNASKWREALIAYVVMKQLHILSPLTRPAGRKDERDHWTTDFLFWIENTVGKGTLKSLTWTLLNDSGTDVRGSLWSVKFELAGIQKTLYQLWEEFETKFPEAYLQKDIADEFRKYRGS